jgi:hypothetical protein
VLATQWVNTARMATLRGMGTENLSLLRSVGITSLEALAEQDPHDLVDILEEASGRDFVDARVRVWVRGARRELQKDAT